jgi:uncharacterized membrane protein YsdA (DUF1294 family)/cold shock CspA family protein
MRKEQKGKIINWNDKKGFGFIAPNNGGDQVFVHVNAFSEKEFRPVNGDEVAYSATKDDQGRMQASKAKFTGEKQANYSGKPASLFVLLFATLFFVALAFSVWQTGLPLLIPIAYAVMSVITFIAYSADKTAAQAGRQRTSETKLHLFALIGGWPGALFAQQFLRHKSRKRAFRVVLWITVIVNFSAIAWLHTAVGRSILQRVIELVT